MTRIALVTPILPVAHDQTRGRFIHETARCLAKIADVRVYFQQSRYPRLPFVAPRSFIAGHVGEDYRCDGIDVEAFSYPVFPLISRAINGHVAAHLLTPRVAAFAPELVLGYWVYPDGYAALRTARTLGLPCVIGALGSDIHVRSGISDRMTGITIRAADALVTVSEAMRQTSIQSFGAQPERVHTIVNGYNTTVFHPRDQQLLRQKFGIPADAKLIVYVGRFVEAKGLRELVQAFAAMAQTDPRTRLALIGDGVMREELSALVSQAGLGERVHLPGGQPPQGVAEWISAADILTLPSWSEGYPNVVVEGLACGRAVVATDVGGTKEILNEHNGILVAPRQPKLLQQALERALDHPWDRAAIAQAMQRTWDDVARETLEVCQGVLQTRRTTPSSR